MTPLALALIAACLPAAFQVQAIPLSSPNACTFLAHADTDAIADLFVIDGDTLTVYPSSSNRTSFVIPLIEGASVVDVADVDMDGVSEVVAIAGDRIMLYEIPTSNAALPPQELLRLHTQLADPAPQPAPHVLVVRNEGRQLLALPCENTFELRSIDGAVVATYPIGPEAHQRVSYGTPFSASSVYPPHIGRRDALELSIHRSIEIEPELPADLLAVEPPARERRRGTPAQARRAAGLEDESWPWFPLKTDGGSAGDASPRVLYASAPPDYRDALIRVRQSQGRDTALNEKPASIGPERRYPGSLMLLENDLPDFDHDGYVDLLLWKAPEPGVSVDALTAVLTAGVWRVDLTVHLFSPEKNRYKPVPATHITCEVPIAWFLSMGPEGPLHHCVLRDFDGDGRTDFGCSTAPNRFSIWCYTETGFSVQPDFDQVFPQPITGVDFRADLEGQGRTTIGLRTQTSLYLIRALP